MVYKYLYAFLALLFLGNLADVPVMFLGVRGELSLYFVFIVGFSVDILSDIFWYWLGRKFGIQRLEKIWFFRKKENRIIAIDNALDKYGMLILFSSKFITTLGVPFQFTAGAHRYPLKKMLVANTLGAGSLLIVVYGLARVFSSDILVKKYLENTSLAFLAFLGAVAILHYLVAGPINKLLASNNTVNDSIESNPSSHRHI